MYRRRNGRGQRDKRHLGHAARAPRTSRIGVFQDHGLCFLRNIPDRRDQIRRQERIQNSPLFGDEIFHHRITERLHYRASTCPSTSCGLMALPTSCADTTRTTSTWPVSISTSTSTNCAIYPYAKFGSACRSQDRTASSWEGRTVGGDGGAFFFLPLLQRYLRRTLDRVPRHNV